MKAKKRTIRKTESTKITEITTYEVTYEVTYKFSKTLNSKMLFSSYDEALNFAISKEI
jgi:hypothetical protein